MTTRLFLICDAATIHAGKMNILGTFDTLNAGKVPFTHDSFTVAAIIDYEASEEGVHRVKIAMVDEDGRFITDIFDQDIIFSVGDGFRGSHRIRCTENNRRFDKFGEYSIRMLIDDHQIADMHLYTCQRSK